MSQALLYFFLFIGLFGLICAVCVAIYIRAGNRDDEATYGAPEGDWRGD